MHIDDTGPAGDGQAANPAAADWTAYASGLAAHYFALQNRTDVHGCYKPLWMRKPDPRTGKAMPSYTAHARLTIDALESHFIGRCRGDLVGIHVSSPEETCRSVVIDFDAHGDGDDPEANWKMALAVYFAPEAFGFD